MACGDLVIVTSKSVVTLMTVNDPNYSDKTFNEAM